MQKIKFINAKNEELDLTNNVNFGVVGLSGFSEVTQEIQTQKVPFEDGSVYLDNLLNERELTITVALNDEKDLYQRYELRRELISKLNPKLGEGYLIYENDFLTKRIKVIPDTPIIPNKNMNEAGTIKVELVFTANNPYWEDLEETQIDLSYGTMEIENNGDVPVSVKLAVDNKSNIFEINNNTNNDIIKFKNANGNFNIDANFGNKTIYKTKLNVKSIHNTLLAGNEYYTKVVSNSKYCVMFNKRYKDITVETYIYNFYLSSDGVNWKEIITGFPVYDVFLVEDDFWIIPNVRYFQYGDILKTKDFINFQKVETSEQNMPRFYINGYFLGFNSNDDLVVSKDCITWVQKPWNNRYGDLYNVVYSQNLNCYILCGAYEILLMSVDFSQVIKKVYSEYDKFANFILNKQNNKIITIEYRYISIRDENLENESGNLIPQDLRLQNFTPVEIIPEYDTGNILVRGDDNKVLKSIDGGESFTQIEDFEGFATSEEYRFNYYAKDKTLYNGNSDDLLLVGINYMGNNEELFILKDKLFYTIYNSSDDSREIYEYSKEEGTKEIENANKLLNCDNKYMYIDMADGTYKYDGKNYIKINSMHYEQLFVKRNNMYGVYYDETNERYNFQNVNNPAQEIQDFGYDKIIIGNSYIYVKSTNYIYGIPYNLPAFENWKVIIDPDQIDVHIIDMCYNYDNNKLYVTYELDGVKSIYVIEGAEIIDDTYEDDILEFYYSERTGFIGKTENNEVYKLTITDEYPYFVKEYQNYKISQGEKIINNSDTLLIISNDTNANTSIQEFIYTEEGKTNYINNMESQLKFNLEVGKNYINKTPDAKVTIKFRNKYIGV